MRDQVKIIGILHIVFGILGALGGVIALAIFGGIAGFAVFGGAVPDHPAAAGSIVALIGTCIALSIGALSVPSIIGGWGLLKFRPWARTVIIVVSVLDLIQFPLGTAIGIYGLVILNNDETRVLFETGGVDSRAPRFA